MAAALVTEIAKKIRYGRNITPHFLFSLKDWPEIELIVMQLCETCQASFRQALPVVSLKLSLFYYVGNFQAKGLPHGHWYEGFL